MGHETHLTQPCVCRSHTCVAENRESAVCVCDMLIEDVVRADTYQLDLWAGKQLLWSGSFTPSEHGELGGAAGVRTARWALGPPGQALFGSWSQVASYLFPNLMGFWPLSGSQSFRL